MSRLYLFGSAHLSKTPVWNGYKPCCPITQMMVFIINHFTFYLQVIPSHLVWTSAHKISQNLCPSWPLEHQWHGPRQLYLITLVPLIPHRHAPRDHSLVLVTLRLSTLSLMLLETKIPVHLLSGLFSKVSWVYLFIYVLFLQVKTYNTKSGPAADFTNARINPITS